VQSVELLFDRVTEDGVRAAWVSLHEAGLPSLAAHPGATNRPHVTLAVAHAGLDAAAPRLAGALSRWLAPPGLHVTLGGLVLFGGARRRWVLARGVVPSRALQAMHEAVHEEIGAAAPRVTTEPLTRPDAWCPHVTLARRLPAEHLAAAVALLDLSSVAGRVVGARLWDSGPARVTDLTPEPDGGSR
jgi:2'-5' RNA ligase